MPHPVRKRSYQNESLFEATQIDSVVLEVRAAKYDAEQANPHLPMELLEFDPAQASIQTLIQAPASEPEVAATDDPFRPEDWDNLIRYSPDNSAILIPILIQ